jgi:hypothetical protein
MRESTDRVESALHGDNHHEYLIATRILENPSVWQQWESEHAVLMRQVAVESFVHTQSAALKEAAFRLIHRKALFEYLRDNNVRGPVRRRIFASFHPTYGFSRAVVAEHGQYLRKACSYLCTNHLGSELVRDVTFEGPMQRYEALYTEYFQVYCNSSFGEEQDENDAAQTALLPLLKSELEACRAAIMNPTPAARARLARDAQLRRPLGDTQRLNVLPGSPRDGR